MIRSVGKCSDSSHNRKSKRSHRCSPLFLHAFAFFIKLKIACASLKSNSVFTLAIIIELLAWRALSRWAGSTNRARAFALFIAHFILLTVIDADAINSCLE